MSDNNWVSFWNTQHSIYVNARHFDVHYRDVANRMLQLNPARTANVLDFGCGEAMHSDRVAAAVGQLYLCEAAPRVRDHLRERFGHLANVKVIGPEELAAMPAIARIIAKISVCKIISATERKNEMVNARKAWPAALGEAPSPPASSPRRQARRPLLVWLPPMPQRPWEQRASPPRGRKPGPLWRRAGSRSARRT